MNNQQIAYLSGIIDGEGTFYIGQETGHPKCFNSRIVVVNTDIRLISWLQETCGGLVYTRSNSKNPNWKLKYEWITQKYQILHLCEFILPYLICKKEQAEIMIQFRKTFEHRHGRNNPVPENIHRLRLDLMFKIRKLNHSIHL